VRLSNPSGFNVAIEAYSISSASGALNTAGWTSLDDADGAGNNDGGWRESNPSDGFLGELLQTGQQAVATGTQFQLGAIYDFASEAEDLVFEFLLAGESDGLIGTVVYEELPDAGVQPGDFDQDDAVDGADLLLWQRSLGGNASVLNGNGSGGATVTGADLQVWKTNFGAVYPGAISAAGAVPEPSAAAIFALAISIYVGLGRRSGGSC
jgi:hypothetical protein